MKGIIASFAIQYGPAAVWALATLWISLIRDSRQKMRRVRTRRGYLRE
jgi:hypothetical protein